MDFSGLFLNLLSTHYDTLAAAKAAGARTVNYGTFLNAVIDFLIVAFVILLVVQQVNRLNKAPAPAPPNTKECPYCKTSIPLGAVRCPTASHT